MSEWFRRKSDKINTNLKKDTRQGIWIKCPACSEVISSKIVNNKNGCCSACNYHFRINSDQYVKIILEDKYIELWEGIKSLDTLNFNATKSYKDQIEDSISKTKKTDAISIFKGKIILRDIAKSLLKSKIFNIKKIKPEIISTGNIGCITQISRGTKIPILHTVEIIDWYTGGPKPNILKNL